MKKFKNIKTGNILSVKNEDAIELMERSDRYTEVTDQPKKPGKQKAAKGGADKPDTE